MDPQYSLSKALESRNIKEFRQALGRDADPTQMDSNNLSIFERALMTEGCAEFVVECIKRGCRADYTNRQLDKTPIHFAIESKDPKIVKLITSQKNPLVNSKFNNLTPLNSIAKKIREEDFADMSDCIKALIDARADPNIPDRSDNTPILTILKNKNISDEQKNHIISYMLQHSRVNLDTYRDGEARRLLQKRFPHLQLPEVFTSVNNFETLSSYLRNDEEDRFLMDFDSYAASADKNELTELLLEAIRYGHNRAFDKSLRIIPDINHPVNRETPIERAVNYGNHYALEHILDHNALQLNRQPLLIRCIQKFDEDNFNGFSDYKKCFEILLDSPKININEVDESNSSPLHYAVHYKNNYAVRELLNRGAYIGMKSKHGDLPISDLSADILEESLDNCITTNNLSPGDNNFKIIMDFKNLVPPLPPKPRNGYIREEMLPIAYIADSKEHKHLLKHPLITSFLYMKWNTLSFLFYMNFLMYALFCICLLTFIILKFNKDKAELVIVFWILTAVCLLYLIAKEVLQFMISPKAYLSSVANYIEILLILFTIKALIPTGMDEATKYDATDKILLAITVLLAAVDLCILVGSLPFLSISTHMLMLREVSKTFIKSFTLYSIFVITFSLCFYILFSSSESTAPAEDDDNRLNKFETPFTAIIKTVVMMTGEFDASVIPFESFYSYLVFLLFIFFITIVLLNLLNGLAVSDTQVIKAQAELNGCLCRTSVLRNYEIAFSGSTGRVNFLINQKPFKSMFKRITSMFPSDRKEYKIAICPNDGNKIFVTEDADSMNMDLEHNGLIETKEVEKGPNKLSCCCWCSEMDIRTVKTAMAVIEKSQIKKQTLELKRIEENRLKRMEKNIDKIHEMMQNILNNQM